MVKYIKQHDERDCGAACLSMIANYYGLKHPVSKYRDLTKTDRNGANLYGLVDAARKIGLEAEALSGNINELLEGINTGEIRFPFIAHIITEDAMMHFVVVFGLKNGKLTVGDPAKGKVKYTVEAFADFWNGYIVTFDKTDEFQTGNYSRGGFRKFFSLLKGQYKILAVIVALSLVISLIGIAGAFVFETVIDDFYFKNETSIEYEICDDDCEEDHEHIQQSENILEKAVNFVTDNAGNFSAFFIMLIVLYFLQAFIQFFRGYLMSLLSKNLDVRLMLSYYNHIIDLPVSSISTRNTGEYISRFSDASTIRSAVSGATLTLLLDSFMVIAAGIFLFAENKILFLISLIMIVLYTVVVLCYRKPIENINRSVMENNARVQSFLKESIDGIETVKSNQAEMLTKDKNTNKFTRLIKSVFKNNIISTSQDSICDMIELIGTVVILWAGFSMVSAGTVTIGTLMTFYALLSYFTEPIKNLIELQPMMQTAVVAAERLNDILDIEAEKNEVLPDFEEDWKEIRFGNVDFRYGNRELTLKNVSFDIKKGEKIAIVGESGCGKTTITKLLMRFYAPEKGRVEINGKSIYGFSVDSIRNKISYVDQNTFLFSDTVKNNLLIGNPSATDKKITAACKMTRADDFISKLPFSYETHLEENGSDLSGGQRQRISIARALLREPKLLILDEATSNLDTVTENGIKTTIFDFDKELTCIIIAHRLNTIKECDRIIVMDNGRIAEIGTHNELIGKSGYYAELHKQLQ